MVELSLNFGAEQEKPPNCIFLLLPSGDFLKHSFMDRLLHGSCKKGNLYGKNEDNMLQGI